MTDSFKPESDPYQQLAADEAALGAFEARKANSRNPLVRLYCAARIAHLNMLVHEDVVEVEISAYHPVVLDPPGLDN